MLWCLSIIYNTEQPLCNICIVYCVSITVISYYILAWNLIILWSLHCIFGPFSLYLQYASGIHQRVQFYHTLKKYWYLKKFQCGCFVVGALVWIIDKIILMMNFLKCILSLLKIFKVINSLGWSLNKGKEWRLGKGRA